MTPPFILASIAMDGIMIIPFTKVNNVYVKTYLYYVHVCTHWIITVIVFGFLEHGVLVIISVFVMMW